MTNKQIIQELLDQGCSRHEIAVRTGLTKAQIRRSIHYLKNERVKPLVKPAKLNPLPKKIINSVWSLA